MSGELSGAVEHVFRGGALASSVPGYAVREVQVAMAKAVTRAIEGGGMHLLEAGTGVGKSFAYLVPAVLSGVRTWVSTATTALQDQLVRKDVPAVLSALGAEADVRVMKGRRNYLCLRKLESQADPPGPELAGWLESTADGDVAGCPVELPQAAWRRLRSDRLDCTGSACPFRGACHFFRARSAARSADVLVVNHHLLVSIMAAGEGGGGGELLVVDEGHTLEEAAGACLGAELWEGMTLPMTDCIALSDLPVHRKSELLERTRELASALAGLTEGASEGEPWDPEQHLDRLDRVIEAAGGLKAVAGDEEELQPVEQSASEVVRLASVIAGAGTESCVFTERRQRSMLVRCVPLDVGPGLRDVVYSSFGSVVVTSATLAVDGSFRFTSERLGAEEATAESFGSPFDYGAQAVLAVPEDLPETDAHGELARYVWRWTRQLAELLGGRVMALFTSYRNLRLAAAAAREDMPEGLELMVQGELGRRSIMEGFRSRGRSVILATTSFWEGVDLPGEVLRAVIIDRLPFPSPGQPLVRARMERIEALGGSSFRSYMLPMAVMRLRQGVGRLIRSPADTGAVLLMDGRLLKRSYGGVFLRSMPPFRRVPASEVPRFLAGTGMEHPGCAEVSGRGDEGPVPGRRDGN